MARGDGGFQAVSTSSPETGRDEARALFEFNAVVVRDGLGKRQDGSVAPRQHPLHRCRFCLVAHALQHFEVAHRRQRERAQLIEAARGLRIAAQVPDQYVGIDEHRQGSLREPSRL